MLKIFNPDAKETQSQISLCRDEIARQGAQTMLAKALELEVAEYVESNKIHKDESGRALVVRNGSAKTRKVTLGAGTVDAHAPRVNDKRDGKKFSSGILPPYLRKSQKVEALLPVLYLRGLSTNDFKPALIDFLGEGASGLSTSSISALKKAWLHEFDAWNKRLMTSKYVYIWADGVNVKVRLG